MFLCIIELLVNLFRFTDNPCKSCYGEIFGESFVLTRDHDLLEFLLSSHKLINKSEEYKFLEPWLGHGLVTSNSLYARTNNFNDNILNLVCRPKMENSQENHHTSLPFLGFRAVC